MTSLTLEDKKEIMEELFGSAFKTKENGVLHGCYKYTNIQVYELSDFSVMVSVGDYLDPKALFISLVNYGAYLKLLHSDEIWGYAFRSRLITDRVANYIENNQ